MIRLSNRDSFLFGFAAVFVLFPLLLVVFISFQATGDDWDQVFYRPTFLALKNSVYVFLGQSILTFPLALVVGVVSALFKYPFRRLSLVLSVFPLILPSFITAIGIQSLNSFLPYAKMGWVDGLWGSIWTGVVVSIPLATIGTILAVKSISRSELESLYQLGGKAALSKYTLQRVWPTTLSCVCLAGLIGLSDFGVSNIMGFHGIASEIQISFAVKFNFVLAAAKALFFLLLILPLCLTAYSCFLKRFTRPQLLTQNFRSPELSFGWGYLCSVLQVVTCSAGSVAMLVGLLQPLLKPNSMQYLKMVWARYLDSLGITLFYGLGSAAVATLGGFIIASFFFSQKHPKLRLATLLFLPICFVMPSSITALGITWISTQLPQWTDFLFRSEWSVILTMGIRFAPVAALLYFLGYSLIPQSLAEMQRLVRPGWSFSKVKLQFGTLWKWGVLCLAVTAILTLADVGAVTLVQQPGIDSFGAYFFGSMDNSPEVLVSSMCVAYVSAPFAILITFGVIHGIYFFKKPTLKRFKA